MKTLHTIIALIISISFYAQEFKSTTDYTVTDFKTELNSLKDEYNKAIPLHLALNGEPVAKLTDMYKEDMDFYLGTTIEKLDNPNLGTIKSIIKVEFEFLACCSNFETYYFMVTNDDELIKLPTLEYMQCEYATEKMEYVFPSQKFGEVATILKTESYLDENRITEGINILDTIAWHEEKAVREYSYNYKN